MTVSTDLLECTATVNLPPAIVSDLCSSVISVSVEWAGGSISTNGGTLTGLPVGDNEITYTATDGCGNSASCTMTVTVTDEIDPIAACDEFTIVSLGIADPTNVFAETFDDGSYDECSDVTFEVRRMDNPSGPGNDATSLAPQHHSTAAIFVLPLS